MAVSADEGLPEDSAITCDDLITVPRAMLEGAPVGRIGATQRAALVRALRYALDIQY